MKTPRLTAILFLCSLLIFNGIARGQPATAPAAPVDGNDDRLTFLTLQLSSIEESIKAVTAGMKAAGYKANVAADKAESYEKGNELMDRKGGAPVPWDQFYGKTARSFYVPSSAAALHAEGNGGRVDVQVATGNHPIARPRQFDYLYRANNEQAAKAKEEVAKMGKQVDTLLARRRKLEFEQSVLWATISLESTQNLEIPFRPLYRFQLKGPTSQPATAPPDPRIDVLRAMVLFLRTADHIATQSAETVKKDQEKTLSDLKGGILAAQTTLQEAVFRAQQSAELSAADAQQAKQALAIAKRMVALCKNMSEAYQLALEGDAAQDEPRKLTFRAQLQESLLAFADSTAEMDAAIKKLSIAWKIKGEVGVDSADRLPSAPVVMPVTPSAAPVSSAPAPIPNIFDMKPGAPSSPTVIPVSGKKAKREFASGETLSADFTFTAADGPYEIKDKLSVTKDIKRIHVSAGPGAEIHGGVLEINGELHVDINGDPANPVVFRNVSFDQFLNGSFSAQYAIFDHCTFHKVGGRYSRGGLSSKWNMERCLLTDCTFPSFKWVDYGLHFSETTFVSMNLPELGVSSPKGKPNDYMTSLRMEWRIFDRCAFENCSVSPTVFWCSESSNYYKCKFKPGPAFESDKATDVHAHVTGTIGDAPDKVFAVNPAKRSPLNVIYVPQPMAVFAFPVEGKQK